MCIKNDTCYCFKHIHRTTHNNRYDCVHEWGDINKETPHIDETKMLDPEWVQTDDF